MPKPTKARPGSLSTGTLRDEDLLPAFLHCAESHQLPHPEAVALVADIRARMDEPATATCPGYSFDSEECAQDMEDIQNVLDLLAPENHYFGTLEGDGADFGFWPVPTT